MMPFPVATLGNKIYTECAVHPNLEHAVYYLKLPDNHD